MLASSLNAKRPRLWTENPIPLVQPTQKGFLTQVASQRSVNCYLVKPERDGDPWHLRSTPGLELFVTLSRSNQRGWHVHDGRLFVVAGARIYEVRSDASVKDWGKINSSRGRVGMASLLDVIVIGDGSAYWSLDLTTGTVSEITAAPRGRYPKFFNQRIIYPGEDGQVFYSELNDATNIPGLNFFSAESLPDEVVTIETTEDQIWIFGTDSAEVWFDSGDADNPIQRVPGGVTYIGTAHPDTVLRLDNSIWVVGQDKEGEGVVWRSSGVQFVRVSNSAVERFAASAASLTAFSYQEEGHSFYQLNSDDGTWCFDIKTNEWHERAWLNRASGVLERGRPEFHAFVYGSHYVGDYESGKIYRMGLDLRSDAGQEIRRQRTSAPFEADGRFISIGEVRLDFAAGVGIDGSGQGTDPLVMVRAAPEGVQFELERTERLGAIGEYGEQVRFYDFGTGRKWVFEVSWSDPVITALKGATAKYTVASR